MQTKLFENTRLIGKLGIVLIIAAAMTVSGAEAASRLFSAYQTTEEANNYSHDQVDLLPTPGEASGEMATTGSPNGEPSAWLLVPLHLQAQSPSSWQTYLLGFVSGDISKRAERQGDEALTCSLGLISTELDQRQTLVGAKPSGTS